MSRSTVVALVVGGALLAAGLALVLTAPAPTQSFGFFSYTPVPSGSRPLRGAVLVSRQTLLGAGLLALDALLACASLAYHLGRRER